MAGNTAKSGLPYAQLTDSANANTGFQNLANALDPLVIPKYANVAARVAANPSPTAGDACFVTALGVHEVYNGSQWVYMYPKTIVLGSTFTVTNSVTLADVTGFTGIALEASSTYIMGGCLFVSSTSSAAQMKVSLNTSQSDTNAFLNYFGGVTGGTSNTKTSVYDGNAGFTSQNLQVTMDSVGGDTIVFHGTVSSVTACILKLQTANGTAGSGRTTGFNAGSYLQLTKIA